MYMYACIFLLRPEPSDDLGSASYSKTSGSVDSLEAIGKVEVMQIDQPTLIQPTEVVVSDAVFVERAEDRALTPMGQFASLLQPLMVFDVGSHYLKLWVLLCRVLTSEGRGDPVGHGGEEAHCGQHVAGSVRRVRPHIRGEYPLRPLFFSLPPSGSGTKDLYHADGM